MPRATELSVAVLLAALFTAVAGADAPAPQGVCATSAAAGDSPGSTAGVSLMATGQPALGMVKTVLEEAAGLEDAADLEDSLLAVDDFEGPTAGQEPTAPPRPAQPEPPREAKAPSAEAPSATPLEAYRYCMAVSMYVILFVAGIAGHRLWQAACLEKAPVAKEARGGLLNPEVRKGNVCSKDEQDDFGCTALHAAADRGSAHDVQALLEAGADVHARDAWDETALHFAARAGSAEACSLLVAHGAEVNPANEQGLTPLLAAAKAGKEPACKLLLERGGHAGGVADDELPPLLSALLLERMLEDPKSAPPPAAAAGRQ